MKAVALLVILCAATAFADWTGYYNFFEDAMEFWQIQEGDMVYGQYDNAGFFYGEVSDDNSTVDGFWFETGDFSGGFLWTSEDQGETLEATFWSGRFDNEYTRIVSGAASKNSSDVTSDEAFADVPGETLNGVWTTDDGYTNYYLVDQGFFEGIYVAVDGSLVGRILGRTTDGSNYVGWWEEYSLEDDEYFEWGNVLGYMHDDGLLQESWWIQTDAVSAHYSSGEWESMNTATKDSDDVLEEDVLDNADWEDAVDGYFDAEVECEVCEECQVCEECEECEDCNAGDDIETQINFDFAGLIPENN